MINKRKTTQWEKMDKVSDEEIYERRTLNS